MPTTTVHDVIVLGTDLAGLMAAGLLRRNNYRVLLVGQGGLRERHEIEGLAAPALPRMLPQRGLAPALDELLDELAVEDPVHQLGLAQDNHLQVVFPDQRIDLFPEPEALSAELRRAVPDQRQAFLQAVDEQQRLAERFDALLAEHPPLPPDGLGERARIRALQRSWPDRPDAGQMARWPLLMRVLVQATTFLSHLELAERAPGATARLVRAMLAGLRVVPDLTERLVKAIGQAGVDVEIAMVAEHLLLEGRSVVGFQALRSAHTHRCGLAMLAGLSLGEAVELVPPALRRARARLAADALRPRSSVFCLNLLLPTEALPMGMARQVLLVRDPGAALAEDNLIRIVRLPLPGRADRELVHVGCLVPHRQRGLGREYLGPLEQRLLEAMGWLIPFLGEHQEGRSSPFWSARSADAGHPAPWLLHRTIETVAPATLGLALHSPQTALKNLLLCGPEILPGLGVEGEAMAARRVVDWLQAHRKLKKIL